MSDLRKWSKKADPYPNRKKDRVPAPLEGLIIGLLKGLPSKCRTNKKKHKIKVAGKVDKAISEGNGGNSMPAGTAIRDTLAGVNLAN